MMNIGLVDVDGHNYPNLALMKISAWHKQRGDSVEWAMPLFGDYDRVYKSKVFNFTPDCYDEWKCETVRGGTGYDIHSRLPDAIDRTQPDYSIYPNLVDNKTAYGFLTRGCPNKCAWCIVPTKEGVIRPYMDVEEIAIEGRNRLVLMDNNVLASNYGLEQVEKIINCGYRIDFNQGLDARLVTPEVAKMLAKVKWIRHIRFGCDTPRQIVECERAMKMIDSHLKTPHEYLLYAIITSNFNESHERIEHFRLNKRVVIQAQPFRDPQNPAAKIPKWQKDMAFWANQRAVYRSTDFPGFSPRKGFFCKEYFNMFPTT